MAKEISSRALIALIIGASCGVLLLASLIYPDVSGNPASRFATMESLVERGTWAIDESTFAGRTVDKIQWEGRTYSTKPPIMPLIGAGVYALARALTGWSLVGNPRAMTTVVRLFLQVIPFALFLFYLWRFLPYWMENERARRWLILTVAFASLLFGYSSKINNHAPAAFLGFAAFYQAYSIRRLGGGGWHWAAAGLFAGLAVTFDLGAVPLVVCLGLYLLHRSPWRAGLLYGLAALVPLAINAWLNIQISGSPLPIYLRSELYLTDELYWSHPTGYDALQEPKWLYLVHLTLGHHGWFAMSPVLLFALPGIRRLWRTSCREEALLFAVVALVVFLFYWMTTSNYGGSCGGFRWAVVTLPFWLLAVGTWLDSAIQRGGARRWFIALALVGAFHALPLVWDPWTRSPWHRLFQLLGVGSV